MIKLKTKPPKNVGLEAQIFLIYIFECLMSLAS